MTEAERRAHRCCFTGHRPEKMKMDERAVCAALERAIDGAIADGFTTFITGMSRGVDIWAGEIVLRKRDENTSLHLICACPHPDFEKRWPVVWQHRFHDVLGRADIVRTICPAFSIDAYQIRNQWMVDRVSRVIAIYNGAAGGTKNTIEYAQSKGVTVQIWSSHS